jgi:hypothetical protein
VGNCSCQSGANTSPSLWDAAKEGHCLVQCLRCGTAMVPWNNLPSVLVSEIKRPLLTGQRELEDPLLFGVRHRPDEKMFVYVKGEVLPVLGARCLKFSKH